MKTPCVFSPCGHYRYTLWRHWQDEDIFNPLPMANRYAMFIGLNPSTADDTKNDPTIRKCIGFAKRWGYGSLCMTNLFAWRDTDPSKMKKQPEPVGDANDQWLKDCASGAGIVIAAWGNHGNHRGRAKQVAALIPNLHCLKLTDGGNPWHPLYVPYETVVSPFSVPAQ